MALTNDDIMAISQLLDLKLQPIKEDLETVKTDIISMQTDITNMQTDITNMQTDITDIKTTVTKNYDLLERFYANQQEHNTDTTDRIDIVSCKLEMYANQIARNTADIKRIHSDPYVKVERGG